MQYQLNILGSLDVFTRKHSENVASIVCRICQYLHLSKDFTEYCTICAYLHDIGKQFIPSNILQKQSALTEEEFQIMKTHTTIGYKICMDDLKLRPYAAGPIYHHEALNGVGYPNALVKNEIPLEGQIIRVADEFDAIISKRQYKSHIEIIDTLKILLNECKPIENPDSYRVPVKDKSVGMLNPSIVKALIKVLIDDTEYEISCIMDYLKDLKNDIKRLSEIEKYDKKRQSASDTKKQNYYLEGCGGDRDPKKRPIMGNVATQKSDYVIFTNDNPRTEDPKIIMDNIISGVHKTNYEIIFDRKEAINKGLEMLNKNDTLLILGKGHEDYQIIGHEKHHLDDKEIVLDYLKKQ